jgi:hypothetical protein
VNVTTRQPLTLTSAIGLARVYEARNMALGKRRSFGRAKTTINPLEHHGPATTSHQEVNTGRVFVSSARTSMVPDITGRSYS